MTTSAPEIDEKDAELVEAEETETETNPAGEFSLVLVDESKPTVDGRYFVPDKVTWREPPIPLLFTTTNGNGHKGGEVGGAITKIWREDGKIKGFGHFESGEKGQELRRLITEGVLTGVSADVGGAMVELEAATETTKEMQKITEGKILGVTALPLQAYDDTRIAVTAAAIPAAPPKDWFENPNLKKVTPISVTADGRVYGHVAAWGTCHVGFNRPGECLTPPHSASNYSHFTIGEVLTAEGDSIPTGPITLGTGHAGLTLNANAARDHYDNTGTAVADVTAGEDQFGIWVSGAMRPSVTDDKIREFRASAPSGDWRSIGGTLEMVGVLAVNVPGFPIPRAKVEFADEQPLSLVAAGAVPISEFEVEEDDEDCGCEESETETELSLTEQLSALEEQVEELAAKMLAEGEFRNYEIPNKKSTAKEITGHHAHHPHGTSILWPAMYEELLKKGMTKEKAARISNANWNRKHKAPGNATSTRVTASAEVEEFHGEPGDPGYAALHPKVSKKVQKRWSERNGVTPAPSKARRLLAKVSGNTKNDKKKESNAALASEIAALRAKKAEVVAKYGSQSREAEDISARIDSWRRVNLSATAIEFVNTHTDRQKRDRRGRFAESGGLGSLTNKYKGVASTIASRDGSASEKADWKRHVAERKAGNSELNKIKAERQAKSEKIRARALARQSPAKSGPAKAMDDAIKRRNSPAGKYEQSQREKSAKAQSNIEALMRKAKEREAGRRAVADRRGSPKASPKPSQPVYQSVASKVAERDGSAREKAAWARADKNRPVGKAEISKEKAERKAKLEKAKARAASRSSNNYGYGKSR